MPTLADLVDAVVSPVAGAASATFTLTLNGVDIKARPITGPVLLALRRAMPQPARPMRHSKPGSLSARVPVDEDDPKYAEYKAGLEAWFLLFRCATVAAAVAMAAGELAPSPDDAAVAKVVEQARRLAAGLSMAAVDAAYAQVNAAGEDLSPAALAAAERELIVRVGRNEGATPADLVEAAATGEGGDGVSAPYCLPADYVRTDAYYVHKACEIYGITPPALLSLEPQYRAGMIAYARLRTAEQDRAVAAAAVRSALS